MRFSSFNYFGPFHLLAVYSFSVFQLIRPKMADDITRIVNTEFLKLDVEWLFHSISVIEGSAKRKIDDLQRKMEICQVVSIISFQKLVFIYQNAKNAQICNIVQQYAAKINSTLVCIKIQTRLLFFNLNISHSSKSLHIFRYFQKQFLQTNNSQVEVVLQNYGDIWLEYF